MLYVKSTDTIKEYYYNECLKTSVVILHNELSNKYYYTTETGFTSKEYKTIKGVKNALDKTDYQPAITDYIINGIKSIISIDYKLPCYNGLI